MQSLWSIYDDWGYLGSSLESKEVDSAHLQSKGAFSWEPFKQLESSFESLYAENKEIVLELAGKWDKCLEHLGGEPSRLDWSEFRMLRLGREEDWSDWLGQLLQTSVTGYLASSLFPGIIKDRAGYANPLVHREIAGSGYRADIVLRWADGSFTHLEVKVGDPNLNKTQKTGEALRNHFKAPAKNWSDYVLVLPEQMADWEKVQNANPSVYPFTWQDVSIGLRKSLVLRNEPVFWQALGLYFYRSH